MARRVLASACAVALSLTACSAILGVDFDARERDTTGAAGEDPTADSRGGGADGELPADGAAVTDASARDANARKADADAAGDAAKASRACPFPVTQSMLWKTQRAVPGACSSSDIAKLAGDLLANVPVVAIKADMANKNALCSSCVFTFETDINWGAVITNATHGMDDPGGGRVMFNHGGCVARNGGSAACARAYQQATTCVTERCQGCIDQGNGDACAAAARNDASTCKPYFGQVSTACSSVGQLLVDCTDVTKLLTALCG